MALTQAVIDYLHQLNASPADKSANGIIQGFLQQYGLQDLASWAWHQYLALGGGPDAINQIQFELPQQHAFQVRFPAYQALAKAGHAMSPGDMIALENSYSQALHGAGLPTGFYDHPNDFAQFMINQVSPSEVAQRAQAAAALVYGDPEALRQAREFGLTSGHQIAWILDPKRALPLINQTILAAQDAAAAVTTGYGQITKSQALALAQSGISSDQAKTGFNQLGMQSGLFAATASENGDISAKDQLAAVFSGNAIAQKRIADRANARTADYKGSGGFSPTQSGVTGLGQPA